MSNYLFSLALHSLHIQDWIQDVFRCLPLDQLPMFLLPRPSLRQRLQPPRLHFGWPFPEDSILDVGDRKTFVSKDFCNASEIMAYVVEPKATEKRIQEITLCELGVPPSSCVPRLRRAYGPLSNYFFALSNNYLKEDCRPSIEDIEKIREFFEFEGPPMWYLDCEGHHCWRYYALNKSNFLKVSGLPLSSSAISLFLDEHQTRTGVISVQNLLSCSSSTHFRHERHNEVVRTLVIL